MLLFTLIARQRDALALAADTDTCGAEFEQCKVTAKTLLRRLAAEHNKPSFCMPYALSVVWKVYVYHILSESGTTFLTMSDAATPPSMAFAFLEDVSLEFLQQYGSKVEEATRPYCFIKFDLYLQRTKKVFVTNGTSRSMKVPRAGHPVPVRYTFDEIMSDRGASSHSSKVSRSGGNGNSIGWWRGVTSFVLLAVLVLCTIFYFFVMA